MDIAALVSLAGTASQTILTATEIGKNLKQAFRAPEIDVAASKQLVLELLDKLIDAKTTQMEIQEAVLTLQRDLQDRDRFEADLARYALEDTGRGAVVYALKQDDGTGDPPHRLCPACVANRKKAILQPATNRQNCLACPVCNARFPADLGHRLHAASAPVRSRRNWDDF